MDLSALVSWLLSRGLQLGARYLGYGLVALFAWLKVSPSESDVAQAAGEIMSGIGIVISVIIDHYLHAKAKGSDATAMTAPVSGAAKLLLVCALIGTASGCNSSGPLGVAGAAVGAAAASYLVNHVAGLELTYDPASGTFGVHTNVRDIERRERVQRACDTVNRELTQKERCDLAEQIARKQYKATAKQRDEDLRQTDKRELAAIEARRKQCGQALPVEAPSAPTAPVTQPGAGVLPDPSDNGFFSIPPQP